MTDRLNILANSYLDQIRIAVEAGDRGAPFRDFFDNWNAFRSEAGHHRTLGYRPRCFNNPSATARIKMLEALDFCSGGAADILRYARDDPSGYRQRFQARDKAVKLIVDHAVPVSILGDMLFNPAIGQEVELNREGIERHLSRWYRLGLVSHEENARLDDAGLHSRMPSNWDPKDQFARYQAVGIEPFLQT